MVSVIAVIEVTDKNCLVKFPVGGHSSMLLNICALKFSCTAIHQHVRLIYESAYELAIYKLSLMENNNKS